MPVPPLKKTRIHKWSFEDAITEDKFPTRQRFNLALQTELDKRKVIHITLSDLFPNVIVSLITTFEPVVPPAMYDFGLWMK
jgi:hypothetical protein